MINVNRINNNTNQFNIRQNYQKLASGKKINRAADDAAGMAIAKKLEKEARALNKATENIDMGSSYTNVADGAMSGMSDYLQSIREVSIRAMNGTYSDSDRQAMQQEVDGYLAGIDQLARTTKFNEHTILDGGMATMDIASNPDGTGMKIQLENSTLKGLGLAGYSVMGDIDLEAVDNAIARVSASRSSMGASANALEHANRYNSAAAEYQIGSQSRIEDLDMGKALSEQSRNKALQDYRIMMQRNQMEQNNGIARLFT